VVHGSRIKSACPLDNETTDSVCPAREAAGSKVLDAELNIHVKIVSSCGIESQINRQGYKV